MATVPPTPASPKSETGTAVFPINRIVAFVGPFFALFAGAVIDWIFVHLNFLANWHTNKSAITDWLTQALVFGLTAILVWLGQQSWLKGWRLWESGGAAVAAPVEPVAPAPVPSPIEHPVEPHPMPGGPTA